MSRFAAALLFASIAGCAAAGDHHGREHVAGGVECRTGFRIAAGKDAGHPVVPIGVAIDDGVSEDEAVMLALWNNEAFNEALADLGFTNAELIQAGLLTNPTFSVLFPLGHKQLEFTTTLPLEALWLRPRRMAVAEADSERVAERLVQNGLDVVRDVRLAFAEVTRVTQRSQLATEAANLHGRIAELADARVRAGDASALEISAARIEAQRAREESVRQTQELVLARVRLRALLGHVFAEGEFHFEEASEIPRVDFNVYVLVSDALAARPDVRAAEISVDAACGRAGLAQLEYLAVAGLIPDVNGDGEKGFEAGPGLQLTLPIFHRNDGGIARAEAEIERSQSHLDTVRSRVALEVREAQTRYVQACEQVAIWQEQILPPAEEALRQAGKAFENGDAPLLIVLETTRQLLDARARTVDAEANLRRAWAELERSVGRRLSGEPGPSLSQPESSP
jgi:cobalt-zinc-cadmium efflux system outer membrane protein